MPQVFLGVYWCSFVTGFCLLPLFVPDLALDFTAILREVSRNSGNTTRHVADDLVVFRYCYSVLDMMVTVFSFQRKYIFDYWSPKQPCIRGAQLKCCACQRLSHRSQALRFKWAGPKHGACAFLAIIAITIK